MDPPTWDEVIPETKDHGYVNTATVEVRLRVLERVSPNTGSLKACERAYRHPADRGGLVGESEV
jgi:hypothetical protein